MNPEDDFDDQQRWINDLLRAGVNENAVSPPDTLRESFRTAVTQQRRFTRIVGGGLAAAAMLLIATGWIVLHTPQSSTTVENRIAASTEKTTSPAAASPQVETNRASFVSNGDTIAVPIESASADVTIVQLYPTTDTEQRWRRELTMSSTNLESTGG